MSGKHFNFHATTIFGGSEPTGKLIERNRPTVDWFANSPPTGMFSRPSVQPDQTYRPIKKSL